MIPRPDTDSRLAAVGNITWIPPRQVPEDARRTAAHRCRGSVMTTITFARLQLELVFTKVFKRLPDLKLAKRSDELSDSEPTMNIGVLELLV